MDLSDLISRRQFMSIGLGAGAVAMVTGSPVHAVQTTPEAAWTPADGLRLAGPVQGIASLDPALARDLQTNFIVRQICRGLVGYDADLTPVPEIAEVMDVSEDQLVYTFTLRSDARFHDGRAVEAADVLHSLSRALNPETAGGDATALAGVIYLRDIVGAEDVLAGRATSLAGVEVLDAQRVRIRLREASATFLMKLAAVPASILDRHQATSDPQWWAHLNGSGPLRLNGVDPMSLIELAPMPVWRSDPLVLASISIRLGADASQPVNLFQAGQIDLVPDVPAVLVPLLQDPASGVDEATLLEMPLFSLAYIALGNQRPPLDDVHVRRALQMAFPTRMIAESMFDGRVLPATGIVPPGMLGEDWPASFPAIDIDAARAEIAASRYGAADRVPPIRIYAADIAPVEALRDVVASELGLVVEAIQVNWYDFLNGLATRRWDAYSLMWGADYPDPEAFLWMLFGSDSEENHTGYSNPELDRLLAEGRHESDPQAHRALYLRAQQVLIDDAAVLPLYVPIGYTLARTGIGKVPVTPMGLLGLETIS